MAQENIKLTLPQTGLECELLPYVTRKLFKAVNRATLGDQSVKMDAIQAKQKELENSGLKPEEIDARLTEEMMKGQTIKLADMDELTDIKVKGLLVKFGDKAKTEITSEDIEALPNDDFNALAKEANRIFQESQEKSASKKS